MSLSRQFFREMRPLFRMLEEPFGRSMHPLYSLRNFDHLESLQDAMTRPAIDISEQGDKYVLDADLPGVSKENIQIWVGDNGRNVTIEGKVVESSNAPGSAQQPAEGGTSEGEHH